MRGTAGASPGPGPSPSPSPRRVRKTASRNTLIQPHYGIAQGMRAKPTRAAHHYSDTAPLLITMLGWIAPQQASMRRAAGAAAIPQALSPSDGRTFFRREQASPDQPTKLLGQHRGRNLASRTVQVIARRRSPHAPDYRSAQGRQQAADSGLSPDGNSSSTSGPGNQSKLDLNKARE